MNIVFHLIEILFFRYLMINNRKLERLSTLIQIHLERLLAGRECQPNGHIGILYRFINGAISVACSRIVEEIQCLLCNNAIWLLHPLENEEKKKSIKQPTTQLYIY